MDFYIYTIGDAEFLHNIFIAIGAIFGVSHEDAFSSAMKLAMLVGVFIIFGKAIASGGKGLSPATFLASIIIYGTMFAPKTDVFIEDVYTGNVYTASEVPLGIAAVGSISSTIGITVTRWFDQAFSLPNSGSGLTGNGYINGLDVLMSSRMVTKSELGYPGANNFNNGEMSQSWLNYIQDCTLIGLEVDPNYKPSFLTNGGDIIDTIKFDSDVYFTEININGVPSLMTCTAAHVALVDYTQVGVVTAALTELKGPIAGTDNPNSTAFVLDDALSSIGQSGYGATRYMTSAMLLPIFEKAVQGKYDNDLQMTSAIMVGQALTQRNIQWAGEQSVFKETFRPMFTFVEGMVYAITPLMALLVLMGPIGISLVGKHLLTLFWIQLWMPLMAIANMFIYLSMTGQMSSIESQYNSLVSIGGMYAMDTQLSTWIATGSYMAASAPALAGFIVYGSSVALTNIANRIQGADFINEKQVTPDVSSTPAMINRAADTDFDSQRGSFRQGGLQDLGSINLGEAVSATTASARQEAETSQNQYQIQSQKAMQEALGASTSVSSIQSLGESVLSGGGHLSSAVNQRTSDLMAEHSLGEEYRNTVAGTLTMGASLTGGQAKERFNEMGQSAGLNKSQQAAMLDADFGTQMRMLHGDQKAIAGATTAKAGGKLGGVIGSAASAVFDATNIAGSGVDQEVSSKSQSTADRMRNGIAAVTSDQNTAELRKAMQSDARDTSTQGFESKLSETTQKAFQASASKAQSSADQYSRAMARQSSLGMQTSKDATHYSSDFAPFASQMHQEIAGLGGNAQALFEQNLKRSQGTLLGPENANRRQAAAALLTMQALGQDEMLSKYADMAYGSNYSAINPDANQSLARTGNAVRSQTSGLPTEVDRQTSNVDSVQNRASTAAAGVANNIASGNQKTNFNNASASVVDDHNYQVAGIADTTQANASNVQGAQSAVIGQNMLDNGPKSPAVAQRAFSLLQGNQNLASMEEAQQLGNTVLQAANSARTSGTTGASEFMNLVSDNGMNIPTPLQDILSQGGAAADMAFNYLQGKDSGNFQQLYAERVAQSHGGFAQQVDALFGGMLMGGEQTLSAATNPETYQQARQEVIANSMDAIKEFGTQYAQQYDLTPQEGAIFAQSLSEGLVGQTRFNDSATKSGLKDEYLSGYQGQELQLQENKFEQIWNAASAGDQAGAFLQDIGYMNNQAGQEGSDHREVLN